MTVSKILDNLLLTAQQIPVNKSSKLAFISDTHIEDLRPSDDFQSMAPVFYETLLRWDKEGFTVFRLGDGKDLWECPEMADILAAYPDIWGLTEKMERKGRWYEIIGNHNSEEKLPEAYVLVEEETGLKILLAHLHQLDWLNYQGSWFSKFVVRYIWGPLQWLGAKDPTTARKDKNPRRHEEVRRKAREWVDEGAMVEGRDACLIGGHSHYLEWYIPEINFAPSKKLFFGDTGSWVGGRGEAIEYVDGVFTMKTFERR